MRAEDIIEALATETRRKIVKLLAMEPLTLSEIAERLGISQPAALKHIRELESSGIIEAHKVRDQYGRIRRCYRIARPIRVILSLDGDSVRIYMREARPIEGVPADIEGRLKRVMGMINELNSADSLGKMMYKSTEIIKEIEETLDDIEEIESQLIWLRYEVLRSLKKFVSRLS